MKCKNCGTELNDGMAFCPNCGAAQNSDNTQFNYSSGNIQYGNAMPVKKKSKTLLVIALAVAVVVIIGLSVTCIMLATSGGSSSKNSLGNSKSNSSNVKRTSTPEETATAFLEALVKGNYSEATEYVLSVVISQGGDDWDYGEVNLSKSSLKDEYEDLTGYKIYNTETLDKNDIESVSYHLNYDGEITAVAVVEIDFIYDYNDYDDGAVIVANTDDGWYIIGVFD